MHKLHSNFLFKFLMQCIYYFSVLTFYSKKVKIILWNLSGIKSKKFSKEIQIRTILICIGIYIYQIKYVKRPLNTIQILKFLKIETTKGFGWHICTIWEKSKNKNKLQYFALLLFKIQQRLFCVKRDVEVKERREKTFSVKKKHNFI